jgi:hypothetical protein
MIEIYWSLEIIHRFSIQYNGLIVLKSFSECLTAYMKNSRCCARMIEDTVKAVAARGAEADFVVVVGRKIILDFEEALLRRQVHFPDFETKLDREAFECRELGQGVIGSLLLWMGY